MLKFAANLSTLFTELPLIDRPAAAAQAGFTAVEMQFPYEVPPMEMASACRDARLNVVLMNLPAGERAADELGLGCLPGSETRFRAALAQALDYAGAIGCRQLNSLAGRYPPGADRAACWSTLVDNSREAAAACAARGVTLLSEVLNPVDVKDFVLSRSIEGERLLHEVGHANFKLQFDVYHRVAAGEDWEVELMRQRELIGHIQFSDFPGRHEPGSGQIDWSRFFGAIAGLPYRGYLGCEYSPSTLTRESFGWRRWVPAQDGQEAT